MQRKNSGRTRERTPRIGAESNRNASATKAGPGRYHAQGHEKATMPKPRGAGSGMVLHHSPAAKKERRALVKALGRRQAIKATKHWRAELKAANDERTDALSTRHYESLEGAEA